MSSYRQGDLLTVEDPEPPRGTVVIGAQRAAWQRSYSDGSWFTALGYDYAKTWAQLLEKNMGAVRVAWLYGGPW